MNDRLNITLNIADQPGMALTIKRSDEEVARTAEYNVNQLWNKWRAKYATKSSPQVLAMVAYKFAELYYQLSATSAESLRELEKFEQGLDEILLGMED